MAPAAVRCDVVENDESRSCVCERAIRRRVSRPSDSAIRARAMPELVRPDDFVQSSEALALSLSLSLSVPRAISAGRPRRHFAAHSCARLASLYLASDAAILFASSPGWLAGCARPSVCSGALTHSESHFRSLCCEELRSLSLCLGLRRLVSRRLAQWRGAIPIHPESESALA